MKKITIHKFYLNLLQELHSCERQTIKLLPLLAEAASEPALQKMFNKHLAESKEHLTRLEYILSCLYGGTGSKTCKVTSVLVKEGKELALAEANKKVRNAGLVCVAQRITHIQIAMYAYLRAYAAQIHRATDVRLLDLTLREEVEADRSLSDFVMEAVQLKFRRPLAIESERQYAAAM
jgi:ferritin-like metal-binding protein YciE